MADLRYSGELAEDFVEFVRDWPLDELRRELAQARGRAEREPRLGQTEERIAGTLARLLQSRVGCAEGQFELANVIRDKTADCLGFAQLLYVLGNSLGLSVKAIDVTQLAGAAGDLPAGSSHVACAVDLTDGRSMMVDVATAGPALVSRPFAWQEVFEADGNYWNLKTSEAMTAVHRRVRVLNRDGLVACVFDNRGDVHNQQGQCPQAIADFTAAIDLDPKCAGAYNNRGIAWHRLGKVPQALADYAAAVQLDPKYGEAYYNRGNVYGTLGDFTEAIADYTRAVTLNEKYTWAYTNRGNAYFNLARFTESIADQTQAVTLDPTLAEAYSNRGNAYKSLGKYAEAVADHTKAIEIRPEFAGFYINRAIANCRLGRSDAGKKDLLKAVALDPALKPRVRELGQHFRLNLGL